MSCSLTLIKLIRKTALPILHLLLMWHSLLPMFNIDYWNTHCRALSGNLMTLVVVNYTIMHRQKVLKLLDTYKTAYMEEAAMVQRALHFALLHPDCFERSLEEGHFTGSAWVLNPAHTHTLMLHHRKLDLWLQPGGHADGDPDITRVVLKEVSEESGVDLTHIKLINEEIFDVDIHIIHANEFDPRHEHFDIRFLIELDDTLDLPGNEESHQIGWVPLDEVPQFNNARSFYRMLQKTRKIRF